MKIRHKLLMGVVALGLLASFPATANPNVDVSLAISSWSYQLRDKTCAVTVPSGADGLAVLDAAKASGCIQSYTAIYYPSFGDSFVDCIDGRCTESSPPFRAWTMRENCVVTDHGVQGFRADDGDELSFTYETIATFFVPAVC